MTELKEFKFVTPLVIEFKKLESDDATKYTTLYSNSRAETIINEMYFNHTITSKIRKYLGKDLVWIIDSVVNHTINTSKYNRLAVVAVISCY